MKNLKISGELILIAWNPRICWNICMSGDGKKETETIFFE